MLERRFRKAIGKGVDEIIRKVRIERSMEMLERSDLPIGEIRRTLRLRRHLLFLQILQKSHRPIPPRVPQRLASAFVETQ